jgi:hypothetical protein
MIYELPEGTPRAVPEDIFKRASVREFLDALDTYIPGLDLSDDRAVAIGLVVAQRARDGYLDKCRLLGREFNLDGDEWDAFIAASFAWLAPGALPVELQAIDPDSTYKRSPLLDGENN